MKFTWHPNWTGCLESNCRIMQALQNCNPNKNKSYTGNTIRIILLALESTEYIHCSLRTVWLRGCDLVKTQFAAVWLWKKKRVIVYGSHMFFTFGTQVMKSNEFMLFITVHANCTVHVNSAGELHCSKWLFTGELLCSREQCNSLALFTFFFLQCVKFFKIFFL
jgi:hypothetical protein